MRYLTRKPAPRISTQVASSEGPETDYQTEVQPDMVIPPQDVLPKNAEPVMPSAPGIPDPQTRQLELATGGRVNFQDAGFATGFKHGNFVPLTKKQREIAKKIYGLKESEVDSWQTDRANRRKKASIVSGETTLETKYVPRNYDPNRIIVQSPRATEKVTNVIFPNKQIEKSFKKDVKEKFSVPQGRSEKSLEYFSKNYPLSERQAFKAVNYVKDQMGLEYPKGSVKADIEKNKTKLLQSTSQPYVESYITSKIKQPILEKQNLTRKIDLAHRISKEHMKYLGLQFDTRTTGFDSRLINQVIIRPSEIILDKLYKKQRNLMDTIKENGLTDELSKQLEDINNKVRTEAKKTNGRLIGVTIDPETLDPYFEGKKAKLGLTNKILNIKEIGEMPIDKRVKFLTNQIVPRIQAEIDKGFTPNDFKLILSDPERQKSIIKHAEQNAPDTVKELKEIFKNPTSTKSLKLYTDQNGIGPFLETEVGQRLSKAAPNFLKGINRVATITGAPINALLGVAVNADEFKNMGLSDLETIGAGIYKGTTQDFLNFADLITRKLGVATYEKFTQNKPFFENLLNKPDFFTFADEQIDKYASEKSVEDRLRNKAEYEVRRSTIPNISDTDVPDTTTSEEYKKLVKAKEGEILNRDPVFKQAYEQELATPKPESVKTQPNSNIIFGPITFPRYSEQELNLAYGGRAKFAEGTEEDDLYIPPLDKPSGTEIPKEGLRGLYYGFRDEPRNVPIDPATGEPIKSGGIKELKQILSSSLPEKRPEIGFANERFNISASKSINPFDKDRDTKYQASYQPNKDSGSFLIEKTPNYTAGGYGYNKDGLSYGISGLVDKMGNKNISARIKYDFATGGRVNFSGGGPAAIKLARMITDVLGGLRQRLFMPAHTQRTTGAKEAKELATRPYTHPTNQSPQSNILEDIEKSKSVLPKEYHSILDDIKKDVENFDYASASNRADALNNQIPDALNFEKLSKDLFPMLDPLNEAIIIFDPKREKMMGRYTYRVSIDPETGRGIRQTYDTWDSQKQRFNEGFEEKLIGVESLEKGKEGLN